MVKDPFKEAILNLLRKQRRSLSTRKIALKTDMAWPTARIKLRGLQSRGLLRSNRVGSKNLWRLPSVNPRIFRIPKPRRKKKRL